MITKQIGIYEINYVPELECATVKKPGLLIFEVVHEENGRGCYELCEEWINEQIAPVSAKRETNKYGVEQLTEAEAIALGESKVWERWTDDEIVSFQLFQDRLAVSLSKYHKALEHVLSRDVAVHEIGLSHDSLVAEYWGDKPKPSIEEIIKLIPEENRIVIEVKR
jgi:hypothetical protein